MRRAFTFLVASVIALTSAIAFAQSPAEKAGARRQSQRGWELMRAEKFEEAEKAFQQAVELDPNFEFAFYGLGRASMALKKFVSAVSAFTRCKNLYEARAGQQFTTAQDRQRYRQDRGRNHGPASGDPIFQCQPEWPVRVRQRRFHQHRYF